MKFKINIIIIIFFSLSFVSCELNFLPEDRLTDESFWNSEDNFKGASNYLYTFLPNLAVIDDAMSDNAFGQVGDAMNQISNGTRLPPVTDPKNFDNYYSLIFSANKIIEKVAEAEENHVDIDDDILKKYTGEAKFFRAWGYFQLVKRYGDVPLIMKTLTINSKELDEAAATAATIYDTIYSDLDQAVSSLPTTAELGTVGFGRISKYAAMSFKARVALFEGTRELFHGYGKSSDHLQIAINSAQEVMNSEEYNLYSDYFNTFQPVGNGYSNHENILVHQYGINGSDPVLKHPTNIFSAINDGLSSPTKALVDSYLMTDGLPIEESPLNHKYILSTDVFKNRDPRLDATVFKIGDPFVLEGGYPPFYIGYHLLNSRVRTGYMQRKFFNDQDYSINPGSFMDYPIIRYAEVLLIFAEATYEKNGSITDEQLDKSINLLRDRVRMPHLTNKFVEENGLNMREEIRRERRVELALEGFRYWDIIRWKTAEDILPQTVYGSYFYPDLFEGNTVKYNLTSDNIIIVQPATARSFQPDRDYLWPLPVDQIALNPNLKQNPGW